MIESEQIASFEVSIGEYLRSSWYRLRSFRVGLAIRLRREKGATFLLLCLSLSPFQSQRARPSVRPIDMTSFIAKVPPSLAAAALSISLSLFLSL